MPTRKIQSRNSSIRGVTVQFAVPRRGLPGAVALRNWANAAGAAKMRVTLRIVDGREGRILNRKFRRADRPTNVLSFPYDSTQGDVVLCHPVISREARAQRKPLFAHYAHLVVHGILHLRGHDHRKRRETRRMEGLEIRVLRRLGFPDPYRLE